ncbi:MAG: energy transducer TonB, partial [Verrucomicrobiae bacterium]|nr:energy transducer TonB [Verrucomicrobiae bacterium]
DLDRIFSLGDLDQKPRVIFQIPPVYPPELRSRGVQGTVYVTFVVDRTGRVVNPSIEKSTDPRFERPALDAVKQWRFEPGMRNGQEVQFKMRVPITFSLS